MLTGLLIFWHFCTFFKIPDDKTKNKKNVGLMDITLALFAKRRYRDIGCIPGIWINKD